MWVFVGLLSTPFAMAGETFYVDGFESGFAAGSVSDIEAQRAEFDLIDPVESNNPNRLAYDGRSLRTPAPLDVLRQDVVTQLAVDLGDAIPSGRINWNSYAGVLQSAAFLKTEHLSNWPMPARDACVVPVEMITCCSYVLTEGADGSGTSTQYYDPLDLYADQNSAATALREIYAQTPLYLPFTDSKVTLVQGWIYNGTDRDPHGSVDYLKPTTTDVDSSFRVRAIAAGTVVAKYWDNWHGNVLVIEHPGPGDFRYRSFYFHLRNGKTNDIARAKATASVSDPDGQAVVDKYLKFANLANPSDLNWGTNSQAIPVNVGDPVRAQQQIAWSGNTGPGGAGAGLKTDGTPTDTTAANNHLHFMLAASHPLWTSGEWLYVDPYGVYEQQSTGCYDQMQATEYDRLLAPYYPYFHGVNLGVFNFYLYYYGQMGWSPAFLSVQRKSSDVIAAGAFKPGLGTSWAVLDYMTQGGFQTEFNTLTNASNNLRTVDHSVSLDGSGTPRHNAIFRPDTVGTWSDFGNLLLADHQTTFDTLTSQGLDLQDFFAYHEGTVNRVAAIYAPLPGNFIHLPDMDSQTFKNVSNDLAEDGWLPVDVNVMELASTTRFSAIYRQTGGQRMMHWGLTAPEYQQWSNFYSSMGWDLEMVQNYAGGNRYAAIWSH